MNSAFEYQSVILNIEKGNAYAYLPYKDGYFPAGIYGTTYDGVYVSGIADQGYNYAVFLNTEVVDTTTLTVNVLWRKF